jgi:hypothetical protein
VLKRQVWGMVRRKPHERKRNNFLIEIFLIDILKIMVNAWIEHLRIYHLEHPENSYKQNMSLARSSYTKIVPVQKGKGAYAAESQAAAAAIGTLGDVSQSTISAIQTDKMNNGAYSKAVMNKRANLYKKLKHRMKHDKFPTMSDGELYKYIDSEIHA